MAGSGPAVAAAPAQEHAPHHGQQFNGSQGRAALVAGGPASKSRARPLLPSAGNRGKKAPDAGTGETRHDRQDDQPAQPAAGRFSTGTNEASGRRPRMVPR